MLWHNSLQHSQGATWEWGGIGSKSPSRTWPYWPEDSPLGSTPQNSTTSQWFQAVYGKSWLQFMKNGIKSKIEGRAASCVLVQSQQLHVFIHRQAALWPQGQFPGQAFLTLCNRQTLRQVLSRATDIFIMGPHGHIGKSDQHCSLEQGCQLRNKRQDCGEPKVKLQLMRWRCLQKLL
jgi:hypothetical protein